MTRNNGLDRPTGADGAEFVRLYAAHRAPLLKVLQRRGIAGHDAADIVQAIFLEYHQRGGQPSAEHRLYGAAINAARNHHTSVQRRIIEGARDR